MNVLFLPLKPWPIFVNKWSRNIGKPKRLGEQKVSGSNWPHWTIFTSTSTSSSSSSLSLSSTTSTSMTTTLSTTFGVTAFCRCHNHFLQVLRFVGLLHIFRQSRKVKSTFWNICGWILGTFSASLFKEGGKLMVLIRPKLIVRWHN